WRTARGPSTSTSPGRRSPASRLRRLTSSLSGELITSLETVLGNLDQPGKGTAVAYGQVGQHLAVDLHSGLAEAVHEPVVRKAALPRGSVDAGDPEPAEVPLAGSTITERVGQRVEHGLVGRPEEQLLGEPEPFRPVEDLLVPGVGGYAALDASHLALDPQRPADRLGVRRRDRLQLAVGPLVLLLLVL